MIVLKLKNNCSKCQLRAIKKSPRSAFINKSCFSLLWNSSESHQIQFEHYNVNITFNFRMFQILTNCVRMTLTLSQSSIMKSNIFEFINLEGERSILIARELWIFKIVVASPSLLHLYLTRFLHRMHM